MSELIVDGDTYDMSVLSEEAKATIVSIRFAEREIQALESRIAVTRTAMGVYKSKLQGLLADVQPVKEQGATSDHSSDTGIHSEDE